MQYYNVVQKVCVSPFFCSSIMSEPGPSVSDQVKKVMLSYQWDYKPLVLKIKDRLEADEYDVWMDDTHMGKDHLFEKQNQNIFIT